MDYVHLHTHSEFSFNSGVAKPFELAKKAKEMGMEAIALTDTNRMSGLILFYQACKKYNIKPILGVELTEHSGEGKVVLLAKNKKGYEELCTIVSQRNLDPNFKFSNSFELEWKNLFFLTNYPNLLQMIATSPNRRNLFGELVNTSRALSTRSKELHKLARKNKIPIVATNDVYFLNRDDWNTHKLLRAIGLNATLTRLTPNEVAPEWAYLKSSEEMGKTFGGLLTALKNSKRIADMCNVHLEFGKWIMPEVKVPGGKTPEVYLRKLAMEGLQRNFLGKSSFQKAKRIQETELKVITKLGYASYFLIVLDIRMWAGQNFSQSYRKPTDCTILRGSAANSLTFFNIGASDLDPIRYDLYFQRFLNEDRASPPDADLDFGWDERDEVLKYIEERWGSDRVAMTCTFQHFRRRASFRETAKVFGYSEEQISEIVKSGWNAAYLDSEVQKIQNLANTIVGKPRFLGQHPGGLLITNDPICRHVGLERSGGEKDRVITQLDMHSGIDELGLIKFDILGNGSLSVLRDTLAQVESQGLPDPDVSTLENCYSDQKTIEVISKGRTRGIFYIESPAQSRLNKKARVETFEELTITSSLVRPAGSAYCNEFIERHRKSKNGIKDWEYLHPSLDSVLKETHGILAFQEDVTKVCHKIAGLTYKQADKIRKMMNSLHEGSVTDSEWKDVASGFIKGCMATSGFDKNQAIELWKMVASFTGFSFCKSHSGSYAQLSFQCAYLKAHFPAQFLSAVISNNHGFYSRDTYLNEARRWGVRILPIDINQSKAKYFGKHDWIRPGFMHIKGLRESSKTAIVEDRNSRGPFRNMDDFLARLDHTIGKKDIEKLILVGAFDCFGISQTELQYRLESGYGRRRGGFSFSNEGGRLDLANYTLTQRCLNELDLLGFMVSGNILDILELHPSSKNSVMAKEIEKNSGRGIKVFGWPVTFRGHTTSNREAMSFMTIEDKTGSIDVIFWPRNHARFSEVLKEPGPFQIWGKVTDDWGTFCLEAENIKPVSWSPAQVDYDLAAKRLSGSFNDYRYHDISSAITAA